jgi:GH15 family glucan-1,4-alpha-glucosidase
MRVRNEGEGTRHIRVFLHHDFRIYENKVGDTAYYDPRTHGLIHFKKHRYFLINTEPHFDQFATGRKAFRSNEGTWPDAEDGELHGNATTEGSVDSTIAVHIDVGENAEYDVYYWIAAGTSYEDVSHLDRSIFTRTPGSYFDSTSHEWNAWVNKSPVDLGDLSDEIVRLYKRSLLIINTQIDDDGAILAANDHDVTERATDHYSYLWTRDGAFVANALDAAGYGEVARKFFEFCCNIIHENGYFLQKYNPDGTVASGWHPSWDIYKRAPMVPIQEDETSLVLWALWQHYEKYRDIDFALRAYRKVVTKAAEFIVSFRDENTGLPLPSWNLWEDRRGVHTFTCSTVVAGLRAAANFAELFHDDDRASVYRAAADDVTRGMRTHLYSDEYGRFLRGLMANGDETLIPDATIDASLFATFYFGCFEVDDPMVVGTMQAIVERLDNKSGFGGVARFENDNYMRTSDGIVGNSWFICTLWLAEYYIALAKNIDELEPAVKILQWVTDRALPSGVLAEQIDPVTGLPTSVSPLTWSHSTFVAAIHSYLAKSATLGSS